MKQGANNGQRTEWRNGVKYGVKNEVKNEEKNGVKNEEKNEVKNRVKIGEKNEEQNGVASADVRVGSGAYRDTFRTAGAARRVNDIATVCVLHGLGNHNGVRAVGETMVRTQQRGSHHNIGVFKLL